MFSFGLPLTIACTHAERKSETLAYLVLKLLFAAAFKSLTTVESSRLGVKASCSTARSGAMASIIFMARW